MTADGHTKGTIDRKLLKDLMKGIQAFQHKTQIHVPFRGNAISTQSSKFGGLVWLTWSNAFLEEQPRPKAVAHAHALLVVVNPFVTTEQMPCEKIEHNVSDVDKLERLVVDNYPGRFTDHQIRRSRVGGHGVFTALQHTNQGEEVLEEFRIEPTITNPQTFDIASSVGDPSEFEFVGEISVTYRDHDGTTSDVMDTTKGETENLETTGTGGETPSSKTPPEPQSFKPPGDGVASSSHGAAPLVAPCPPPPPPHDAAEREREFSPFKHTDARWRRVTHEYYEKSMRAPGVLEKCVQLAARDAVTRRDSHPDDVPSKWT